MEVCIRCWTQPVTVEQSYCCEDCVQHSLALGLATQIGGLPMQLEYLHEREDPDSSFSDPVAWIRHLHNTEGLDSIIKLGSKYSAMPPISRNYCMVIENGDRICSNTKEKLNEFDYVCPHCALIAKSRIPLDLVTSIPVYRGFERYNMMHRGMEDLRESLKDSGVHIPGGLLDYFWEEYSIVSPNVWESITGIIFHDAFLAYQLGHLKKALILFQECYNIHYIGTGGDHQQFYAVQSLLLASDIYLDLGDNFRSRNMAHFAVQYSEKCKREDLESMSLSTFARFLESDIANNKLQEAKKLAFGSNNIIAKMLFLRRSLMMIPRMNRNSDNHHYSETREALNAEIIRGTDAANKGQRDVYGPVRPLFRLRATQCQSLTLSVEKWYIVELENKIREGYANKQEYDKGESHSDRGWGPAPELLELIECLSREYEFIGGIGDLSAQRMGIEIAEDCNSLRVMNIVARRLAEINHSQGEPIHEWREVLLKTVEMGFPKKSVEDFLRKLE